MTGRTAMTGQASIARRQLAATRSAGRLATSRWRALPDFLIIGAMKAGTTSLYSYLADHPQVLPAARKEVRYFDVEYHRGERWYRSMFPTRAALRRGSRITGEASPYYLRHPRAAERCAALLPDLKLLVLLRDPTERAYSHYRHAGRLGLESLSFPAALAAERERDRAGAASRPTGPAGPAAEYNARHHSYLSRGHYAEQLERWLEFYHREQLLVCTSEQLLDQPLQTYREVLTFLGLRTDHRPRFDPRNVGVPADLDPALRAELHAEFAEPNRRLATLLGRQDPWQD